MTAHLFFLVWWLVVNGTINYLSMDFLLYMTKAEERRNDFNKRYGSNLYGDV